MEKKNISQKQFRRISTISITGLGVLVIGLDGSQSQVCSINQKRMKSKLTSIKHEMKPNMEKDGTFRESIYHKQPVKRICWWKPKQKTG